MRVDTGRGVRNAVSSAHEALKDAATMATAANQFATAKDLRERCSELERAFAPFFRKEEERTVAVEQDCRSTNHIIATESPNSDAEAQEPPSFAPHCGATEGKPDEAQEPVSAPTAETE